MPSNLPVQDNLTQLWEKVVQLVSKQSQNENLDIFLAGSRPVNIDEGTLWVVFPNKFFRDWVETRYLNQLSESLNAIIGEPVRLRLIVNGEYPTTETNHLQTTSESFHTDVDVSATPVHTPTPPQPQQPVSQMNHNIQETTTNSQPNVQIISTPSTTEDSVTSQSLNPKYTFDTFVVGSANRFAHAAALAAASKPATVYNPLFLYGGVGLGKTHLMQAVGHYVLEHLPNMHVVYVSSERFTNDLINSLQNKSMAEFRQKYRNVDVLLIDDIQFIAGKESTQEEFFHTFNALYQANKQIVLSSDRLPKEIPTLEDRLRSRFESGLTADVQAPDLETRVAILRQKARCENIVVPDDVLDLIATNIQSNIRELEGALTRVMAYAAVHEGPVTVPMAAEALKEIISSTQTQPITIQLIKETVASFFNLKVSDLTGKRRSRAIVHPRQIAMYLARELTDASLPRIGEEFGGRDHTTVMHACDKIRSEKESDPNIASTIRTLKNKINDRT